MVYDKNGNEIITAYDMSGNTAQALYDVDGALIVEPFDYSETFQIVNNNTYNATKTGFILEKESLTNMPLDWAKYELTFTYYSGAVFGVFLSGTLAEFDGSKINVYKTYVQWTGETPQDLMFSQNCTLVDGQTYTITMTRKSYLVEVEIADVLCSGYTWKIGSAFSNSTRIREFGFVVFEGSVYAISSKSYFPYFAQHVTIGVFGDSITEGVGLTTSDYNERYDWQLLKNHYDYDGITCGVGGSNAISAYNRFVKCIEAGYTFDWVLYYVGTNDGVATSGIDALAEKMQGIVDNTKAQGCKVIWCILPVATNDNIKNARSASLRVTGADIVVDFANVLAPSGLIHPEIDGHRLMYQECMRMIEAYEGETQEPTPEPEEVSEK